MTTTDTSTKVGTPKIVPLKEEQLIKGIQFLYNNTIFEWNKHLGRFLMVYDRPMHNGLRKFIYFDDAISLIKELKTIVIEYKEEQNGMFGILSLTKQLPLKYSQWKPLLNADGEINVKTVEFKLMLRLTAIDNPEPFYYAYIERKSFSEDEMLSNMQFYMEHCQTHDYVTPQDWLKFHKHF